MVSPAGRKASVYTGLNPGLLSSRGPGSVPGAGGRAEQSVWGVLWGAASRAPLFWGGGGVQEPTLLLGRVGPEKWGARPSLGLVLCLDKLAHSCSTYHTGSPDALTAEPRPEPEPAPLSPDLPPAATGWLAVCLGDACLLLESQLSSPRAVV